MNLPWFRAGVGLTSSGPASEIREKMLSKTPKATQNFSSALRHIRGLVCLSEILRVGHIHEQQTLCGLENLTTNENNDFAASCTWPKFESGFLSNAKFLLLEVTTLLTAKIHDCCTSLRMRIDGQGRPRKFSDHDNFPVCSEKIIVVDDGRSN
jgi:hypothetical protein